MSEWDVSSGWRSHGARWSTAPRPPPSVIVQAFEVEAFPVCEARHLQMKRSKRGMSSGGGSSTVELKRSFSYFRLIRANLTHLTRISCEISLLYDLSGKEGDFKFNGCH